MLKEWTYNYLNHLNAFKKNITKIEDVEDGLICEYSDKPSEIFVIKDRLDDSVIPFLEKENIVIVCLNSKKNIAFLAANWNNFTKSKTLKVIFSNPELNLQWTLKPYLHNMVSDPASLKLGLKSLFESVPET